jgi:hypothetical protein
VELVPSEQLVGAGYEKFDVIHRSMKSDEFGFIHIPIVVTLGLARPVQRGAQRIWAPASTPKFGSAKTAPDETVSVRLVVDLTSVMGDRRAADQIHMDAQDGMGRHRRYSPVHIRIGRYTPDRSRNSRGTWPHQRVVAPVRRAKVLVMTRSFVCPSLLSIDCLPKDQCEAGFA